MRLVREEHRRDRRLAPDSESGEHVGLHEWWRVGSFGASKCGFIYRRPCFHLDNGGTMKVVEAADRDITLVDRDSRVFVAGHRGLVGSALVRALKGSGHEQVLTASRDELDLRMQADVFDWFADNRPEFVYVAAGTVGGIMANSTRPAEFLYDNLMIHASVIHAAHQFGVRKLLYLGSSCIYPRLAAQPMAESELLAGELEPTNEAYAIAKIAGIKMCSTYRAQYGDNFISAMPTNLYGPGDNFDLQGSHVLPALIRKFHEAKLEGDSAVTVWGSGQPRREFLHVDDLADACLTLMSLYDESEHINVGTGTDLSIADLATLIGQIVYPEAEIRFDTSKPDGTPRKLLDVTRLESLGWTAKTPLGEGIRSTYEWFKAETSLSKVAVA